MAALELDEWLPPTNDSLDLRYTDKEQEHLTNGHIRSPDHPGTTSEDCVYPHPTIFQLTEKPIDDNTSLKVCVIGAGLTGITAGILLPSKVPGIQLTILEKNSDVVSSQIGHCQSWNIRLKYI